MAEITRLKTIAKLLEEELLSPVHGVWLASPKHFQLRPLPLKAGERLMEESGVPEHTTTHTFLDKDEREVWQFVESYCGYWRQHATVKVYYWPQRDESLDHTSRSHCSRGGCSDPL